MVPKRSTLLNFIKEVLNTRLAESTKAFYPRLVLLRSLGILFFWRLIIFAKRDMILGGNIVEEMNPCGHLIMRNMLEICLSGANSGNRLIDISMTRMVYLIDDLYKAINTCFSCSRQRECSYR